MNARSTAAKVGIGLVTVGATAAGMLVLSTAPAHAAGSVPGTVTATSLAQRRGPSTHLGWSAMPLVKGTTIALRCSIEGTSVLGNRTWYATVDGSYVSARYVRASAKVKACPGSPGQIGYATTLVNLRQGPTTSDAKDGALSRKTPVEVTCKITTGQAIGPNTTWFRTKAGRWVSAVYIDVDSAKVPMCGK